MQTITCLKPSGEQGEIKLDVDYKVFSKVHYSPNGKCAFLVAGSPSMFTKLIKVDVKSGTTSVIRATQSTDIDAAYFSIPKEMTWDTTDDAKCYGYYYPPQVGLECSCLYSSNYKIYLTCFLTYMTSKGLFTTIEGYPSKWVTPALAHFLFLPLSCLQVPGRQVTLICALGLPWQVG